MDRLPFYELEELLDCLKELAEKEEEERKKKEGGPNANSFNMNSMARQMRNSMPPMPGGGSMPSFPSMNF
jgi:hypothetical protein